MYFLVLNLCETPGFLRCLYIIKIFLKICCIIVPIILIILMIFDVAKIVFTGDQSEFSKLLVKELKRLIAGLIIFFIPSIVNFCFSLVSYDDSFMKQCLKNSEINYIKKLESQIIENATPKNEIINISEFEKALKETIQEIYKNQRSQETDKIIDDAINWAVNIANDDRYGYSNVYGYQRGQNGQYNCIGLVSMAYVNAGVNVYEEGNFDITKMYSRYLKHNFIDVTDSINLKTGEGLKKGDVLWRLNGDGHGHTEMYIGDGKLVGARSDNGGGTSDVDGNEIAVSGYYNMPWQKVLRYNN